MAQENHTPT